MTTPNTETAKLIREYAEWARDECYGPGDTIDPLLTAIIATDASDAEACCHMGRALICMAQGREDAPYRLGGEMCDPRITELAARLGVSHDR